MAAYTTITGNLIVDVRAYKGTTVDLAKNKNWYSSFTGNPFNRNMISTSIKKFDQSIKMDYKNIGVVAHPYINIPMGNFTASYWIYMDTVIPANEGYTGFFIASTTGQMIANLHFRQNGSYYNNPLNDLEIHNRADYNGWVNFKQTETIPRKTWTHVGLVREGNQIREYINGVLKNTGTLSFTNSNPIYSSITFLNNRDNEASSNHIFYMDDIVFIDNQVIWTGNSITVPTDYFTGEYTGPIHNRMKIPTVVNSDSNIELY